MPKIQIDSQAALQLEPHSLIKVQEVERPDN
jgi:hypothetical protein